MLSVNRGIWAALVPLWFFLVNVFAPLGCSCGAAQQAPSNKILPCLSQHDQLAVLAPLKSKNIVPGTLSASFAVTDSGNAALSIPLVVPPGRAGVEPSLAVSYSSNGGEGVLGSGFALASGASAVTRCPRTRAVDGDAETDAMKRFCDEGPANLLECQIGGPNEFRV